MKQQLNNKFSDILMNIALLLFIVWTLVALVTTHETIVTFEILTLVTFVTFFTALAISNNQSKK